MVNISAEHRPDYERMLALIQTAHAGQMRAGNRAQWQHCVGVMELALDALANEPTLSADARRALMLACLGHDLYEDTNVTPADIARDFGSDVADLISLLTNPDGDKKSDRYVAAVMNGPEEGRILKICDAIDNYVHVAKNREELGLQWIYEFFLPLVEPMTKALEATEFTTYTAAGTHLQAKLKIARKELHDAVNYV